MHCRQRFRRALIAERMYNRPAPGARSHFISRSKRVPPLHSSPRAPPRSPYQLGVAAAAAGCGAAKGWHRDDRAASGQPKQAAYARSAKVRPLHARLGSSSASSPGFNGGAGSPGCWIPARPRSVRSRADALHETRRSRSPSSTKTAAFSPERRSWNTVPRPVPLSVGWQASRSSAIQYFSSPPGLTSSAAIL